MPYKKGSRWLADWRDSKGTRKRRSFTSRAEATAFEKQMLDAREKKTPITAEEIFLPISAAAALHGDLAGHRIARQLAKENASLPADKITPAQIHAMQAAWHAAGWTQCTCRQYAQALKRTLRLGGEKSAHLTTLSLKVKHERNAPVRDVTASPAEIDLLLEHAHQGLQMAILLCHDSGLRIAEACRVCPAGTSIDTASIAFIQKGSRPRSTQITKRTIELIGKSTAAGQEPYITNLWPHPPASRTTINKDICEQSFRRLKRKLHMRPELHFHDLRRTLATNAFEETGDLRIAQALLGHDSIATTARYIAPRLGEDHRDLLELLAATSKWRTPTK